MFVLSRKKKAPEPPISPPPPKPDYTLPSVPSTAMRELDKYLVDSPDSGQGQAQWGQPAGKAKVSGEAVPIKGAFHKPSSFHASSPPRPPAEYAGARSENGHGAVGGTGTERTTSIASLYSRANFGPKPLTLGGSSFALAALPSSPPNRDGAATPSTIPRSASFPVGVRRSQRQPPSFNLMAAGPSNTGKTSFLRTLLGTAKLAPASSSHSTGSGGASKEEVARFGTGKGGRTVKTKELERLAVDVVGEGLVGERIALTVIDTPGWEAEKDDYRVDLQVASLIRYIEGRFDDSLKLESQVHRNPGRAGDSHVHLILYFVDPSTVVVRPYASSSHTRSASPFASGGAGTRGKSTGLGLGDEADLEEQVAGMSQVDIRQIQKLAKRANVLPVIARADELTNARLVEVKEAVVRDLRRIGIDFGVFQTERPASTTEVYALAEEPEADVSAEGEEAESEVGGAEAEASSEMAQNGTEGAEEAARMKASRKRATSAAGALESSSEEEVDRSRPQNANDNGHGHSHLKPSPRRRSLSARCRGSRPRPSLATGFLDSDTGDRLSDEPETPVFDHLLPFSLISPESTVIPLLPSVPPKSSRRPAASSAGEEERPEISSEGGGRLNAAPGPGTTLTAKAQSRFVRTFRWGTVDVLNPEHCDVSTLKSALLGSHMKLLKDSTRHSKYEKWRTEQLLVRRATKTFSEVDRRRLYSEVDAFDIPKASAIRLRLDSRVLPVPSGVVGAAA